MRLVVLVEFSDSLLDIQALLSHYEILEKLGEGGMGVVYKARDTRLDRTVAVKVLPPDRIRNPQARERFQREARLISKLNHPNICTLYDVGHAGGVDFLVMEYLDGKPLEGPLPVGEALALAVQIADALDHAHHKSVTHRDLKPGNIMVTKAGAKLLDFGLAKLTPHRDPDSDSTATNALTRDGTILGTYHYMAPEQLEGKDADARSDIFSFGAVLYEMVTGRRAFEGETQASLIAATLEKDPPPVSSLKPMAPRALDRTVRRCLAKEPDRRWQSAADLKDELAWIAEPAPEAAVSERRPRRWVLAALAAALVVAIGIIVALLLRGPETVPEAPLRKFALTAPTDATYPAISPDGRHIAYLAGSPQRSLWIQDLDRHQPRQIEGTEGAQYPFWSPGLPGSGPRRFGAVGLA